MSRSLPRMLTMPSHLRIALALSAVVALVASAPAADQPLLGKSIKIVDPKPTDATKRKVTANASDAGGGHTISGDPAGPANSSGAILVLDVAGATPSSQTFTLPQGTAANGKPFWVAKSPAGWSYSDPKGEQGPVSSLRLVIANNGKVTLKAVISGKGGAVDVVPPNPGTQASLTLGFAGGDDRYCVQFGADGVIGKNDAKGFGIGKVTLEGCPASVSGDFLALSYNVAGLPEGISGSNPSVNTPLIAPLLNGYELVLVQESWKTPDPNPLAPTRVYHEILEAGSLHPFRSESAPLPLGTDPFRPSAFVSDGLNQFSNFPFGALVRQPWSTCVPSAADCLALKGFSMSRVTFAPGVVVDVYNLHMEAGGDPEDDTARDADVTQLSNFIQANSAGRPVIVGGDFNLHTNVEPDSSQFQRLLAETGLVDVCAALSCPSPGRIDKFLFRSSDRVTLTPQSWHFETEVFEREDGESLSDHDALAVRFGWEVLAE
jgi:hypothetical protein